MPAAVTGRGVAISMFPAGSDAREESEDGFMESRAYRRSLKPCCCTVAHRRERYGIPPVPTLGGGGVHIP